MDIANYSLSFSKYLLNTSWFEPCLYISLGGAIVAWSENVFSWTWTVSFVSWIKSKAKKTPKYIKTGGGTFRMKDGTIKQSGEIFFARPSDIPIGHRDTVVEFDSYTPNIYYEITNKGQNGNIAPFPKVYFFIKNQEAFDVNAYVTIHVYWGDNDLGTPPNDPRGYYCGNRLWNDLEISKQGFHGNFDLHQQTIRRMNMVKIVVEIDVIHQNGDSKKLPLKSWIYSQWKNDWVES